MIHLNVRWIRQVPGRLLIKQIIKRGLLLKKTLCIFIVIFSVCLIFTGCAAVDNVDKNIQKVNDNVQNVNKGIQDIKKNAQDIGNQFTGGSEQENSSGESESSD